MDKKFVDKFQSGLEKSLNQYGGGGVSAIINAAKSLNVDVEVKGKNVVNIKTKERHL